MADNSLTPQSPGSYTALMNASSGLFEETPQKQSPTDVLFDPAMGGLDKEAGTRRRHPVRRFLLWTLAVLLALAACGIAVLPRVVSSAPVRRAVVSRINGAQPDFTVSLDGWAWRWFKPCRIDALVVRKRDQSATLTIPSVTLSKGLAAWLGTEQDFGVVTVDGPSLSMMEFRPEDRTTASGASGAAVPASTPVKPAGPWVLPINPVGEVVVRNGKAEAFPLEGAAIRIADIGARLTLAGRKGPVSALFECGVPRRQGPDPAASSGTVRFEGSTAVLQEALLDPATVPFEAKVEVPPVDLASLDAFLPASDARPRIRAGLANLQVAAKRGGTEPGIALDGRLEVRRLHVAGGSLGTDAIQWKEASLSVDARKGVDHLTLRDCRLETPWAVAQASGTLPLGGSSLAGGTLTAEGQVDVAAMAAQIPRTLRLKEGTTLKKGLLRFDAEATAKAEDTRVFGMFRCDGFEGVREGRPVRVDFPFTLGADARLAPTGEAQDATVRLTSPSLQLTLSGSAAKGTATGKANLGALTEALEALFNLDSHQRAAGSLSMEGGWSESSGRMAVTAKLSGEGVWLARRSGKPLEFPSIQLKAGASLPAPQGADGATDLRDLSIEALLPYAKLTATAASMTPQTSTLQGFQAQFEAKTAPLLALAGGKSEEALAETISLTAAGEATAETVTLKDYRVLFGPFDLAGQGALTALKGERLLTASGTSKIDLDALQQILQKKQLDGVALGGKSERPYRVSMPLGGGKRYLLSVVELDAGVLAQRLAGLGMTAQDSEVTLKASQGALRVAAHSTVNEGRLNLEPTVDLLSEPPLLTLPKNAVLLTDAKLTNEMLDQQLARMHPIFKGCGVSSGWVSVTMGECAVPVASNALQRMAWTASMRLRDVRLAAAGPLDQAATALGLRQKEVVLTNQTVSVSCRNGRLYPQPLALTLGGHPIRVAGSVGLDGSLDYAVEVPLTEALLGAQAFRYVGAGQTFKVPLTGTASRPHLDVGALEAEIRRLVTSAATRAATGALMERLQRRSAEPVQPEGAEDTENTPNPLDPVQLEGLIRQLTR